MFTKKRLAKQLPILGFNFFKWLRSVILFVLLVPAFAMAQPEAKLLPSSNDLAMAPVVPSVRNVHSDSQSAATTHWSIVELQRQALQTSPTIAASVATIDAARGRLDSAKVFPNPTVEYVSGQRKSRLGLVSGSGQDTTEVTISQPLEWPDARGARIQAAILGVDSSQYHVRYITNDVLADIRLRALEWLIRQEDLRFLEDALSLIEQTRDRIAVKVDTGEAAKYELIKAEAEVLSARSRLDSARADAAFVKARLSQLVGLQLGVDFSLKEPSRRVPEPIASEDLIIRINQSNPELRFLETELQFEEKRLAEQQALRKPALALRARQDQDPEFRTQQLGVSVTVPLFDTRRGLIQEQLAQVQQAQTFLQGRRYELTQKAYAFHAKLLAAKRRVEALEEGVLKQAEAALAIAQAAYKFGERGILDTLDAQRVLRSVRSDFTQARLEAFSAAAELDRVLGAYLDLVPVSVSVR